MRAHRSETAGDSRQMAAEVLSLRREFAAARARAERARTDVEREQWEASGEAIAHLMSVLLERLRERGACAACGGRIRSLRETELGLHRECWRVLDLEDHAGRPAGQCDQAVSKAAPRHEWRAG